ncbi:hypothetical protein ABE137_12395 [Brevibacillus laterosporus]|uniref:hypothetical protein n=1 Tax=Brevibacillus phage Sundance TaxID=1691958 RepID=UPI0006BD296F|nr:hypothetical protein AVT09_gp156 [Brevibacillus phage Sundance]ALA47972.1 hypothetical protein SUNDANCE_156 [Brevibacillus phage Sundance]
MEICYEAFFKFLSKYIGYINTVRVEDTFQILVALLVGYIIGHLRMVCLIKREYKFTDKLKNFVYQVNECGDVIEYTFRKPTNFLERLQFLVGLYAVRFKNRNKRLSLSTANKAIFIMCVIFIILTSLLMLAFLLAYNVTLAEDIT